MHATPYQASIFDALSIPRARRHDPETSHAAAEKAARFIASHRNKIMAAIVEPMTPREIAAKSGIDYVAVQRRLIELRRMGRIVETGVKRDGCREWRRA